MEACDNPLPVLGSPTPWPRFGHMYQGGGSGTIFDKIYPIGSIYLSVSSTSPATLFGGTWEQIQDKFLLSAGSSYSAGSTGGNATHQHVYGIALGGYYQSTAHEGSSDTGALSNGTGSATGWSSNGSMTMKLNSSIVPSSGNELTFNNYKSTANTSATSTLPPYLVVYAWKRTA